MYKNILVPVVIDEVHNTQASYQAALALADDDANFTVLHVFESIPAYVMNEVPHDMVVKARTETAEALEISASALPRVTTHLAAGHPGRYIIDFANENDIDCIIIASHKPGLEDFFLGSTANRVVRHARCSVHILR